MPEFMVEMHGDARELYIVEAETAEEAKENWDSGTLYLSENSSMEIYDAWLEEEE